MIPNYQPIIDSIGGILLISFPIALVFYVSKMIISTFLDFVLGREVKF